MWRDTVCTAVPLLPLWSQGLAPWLPPIFLHARRGQGMCVANEVLSSAVHHLLHQSGMSLTAANSS